jgi:hypothetical protein
MAGFLFKLETPNGEPAEPSSFSSAGAELGAWRDDSLRPQDGARSWRARA